MDAMWRPQKASSEIVLGKVQSGTNENVHGKYHKE